MRVLTFVADLGQVLLRTPLACLQEGAGVGATDLDFIAALVREVRHRSAHDEVGGLVPGHGCPCRLLTLPCLGLPPP